MSAGDVSDPTGSVGERFESTGARFLVFFPWLPPVLLIWLIWFGDRDHVPIALVLPATGALAVVGWLVARRVALTVDSGGVSYCNGLWWHRLPVDQISSVRAKTAGGWLAMSGRGLRFMTRGPTGQAPKEYGLAGMPRASLTLADAERQRLVAALTNLLGPERTDLSDW